MTGRLKLLGDRAAWASARLSWLVERICVVLAILLVLDVWLGVLVRYLIPLPLTFMEEAARYLMIWTALLAVSPCISRREHIGVELLFDAFPNKVQRVLLGVLDVLAIAFFAMLLFYGIGMVEKGARHFTMIYGMTKTIPFAAVPVSAALACIQLILVAIRDQARWTSAEGPIEPGKALT
ncbi:MAG: TRAP transporter small permease [Gammaproteobacteria bacterium]|nr:TRAP transporter small permease [Gammaproteobacteria bacterium]MDH3413539.1 TRAP transporter small permease [Gammaproteobacteria bacterium]